uniref:NADH-ubiquinone oxidoreductase chain 4 n=1 Tax=Tyraphus nitidus TaxID=2973947 RepID=A0A976UF22_9COLE|nr:NADH dehydrogenase subunit 4 [Tyraphus nitidus]UVG40772.1 NADH dehydrogenase subunit 4 [Tyraphus nitidus]
MMKFIFFLLFMMPLSFFGNFWLIQLCFFIISFFFIFNFSYNFMYLNLSYYMGCDLLGFILIMLSFWICSLMMLASSTIYLNKMFSIFFSMSIIMLMLFLFITFSSINMFIFYLFFEMSLIPMMFIIVGWGNQPERLQAGIYLLFYTLFASLPMMIGLFYIFNYNMTLFFTYFFNYFNSIYLFVFLNMVFLVKMPMYLVHLWLPKAHVEAPISGSMILAGVMLKMGGYGMIRVLALFKYINFFNILVSISLYGGFIVSLICLRQTDMKSLVAYSSVAHMGMVLGGLISMNYFGMVGSIIMMLAHGLCSSGLFCLVNINYERLMSRSLFLNKGMINIIPSISLWWFLFSSSNMAAPPSLNLLGEIALINSLFCFNNLNMGLLSMLSFFGAGYSLYLYSYSQHGKFSFGMYSFNMIYIREYLLLMLHWLPLNFLFLKSEFIFM